MSARNVYGVKDRDSFKIRSKNVAYCRGKQVRIAVTPEPVNTGEAA